MSGLTRAQDAIYHAKTDKERGEAIAAYYTVVKREVLAEVDETLARVDYEIDNAVAHMAIAWARSEVAKLGEE